MMRAPARDREADRIERAFKDAKSYLTRLKVISFNEANTDKPADELQAAIAVLQGIVDDKDPGKITPPAQKMTPDQMVQFIKDAIKAILPALKRARPGEGRHGRHASTHTFRNHLIRETVKSICRQHGFRPTRSSASRDLDRTECGCSIVSKALQANGIKLSEKRVRVIWENPD
jgi:hypothetical protein